MMPKFTATLLAAVVVSASVLHSAAQEHTLAQKLEAQRAASKADAATRAQMQKAIQELAASKITQTALKKGQKMPDFSLPLVSGKERFTLSQALKKGPVVLVYYRGDWCPYCNLQLAEYQQVLKGFTAAGATVVAVSPQTAENSKYAKEDNPFDFPILVDPNNGFARKLGIVFELPDYLQKIYGDFGIDLHVQNGSKKMELPLAATYIIQPDGTIAYSYLEADYTKRAEPNEVLAQLKKLGVEK